MAETFLARNPLQRWERVVTKTLCYRLLMVVVSVTVAWLVVGDVGTALNIGIATNVVKTVAYYGHERLWDRIAWGI